MIMNTIIGAQIAVSTRFFTITTISLGMIEYCVLLLLTIVCRQAIMATAMYNLERFHGRQYFSLDDGLFPFIETHWQVLCNGKSSTCISFIIAI